MSAGRKARPSKVAASTPAPTLAGLAAELYAAEGMLRSAVALLDAGYTAGDLVGQVAARIAALRAGIGPRTS